MRRGRFLKACTVWADMVTLLQWVHGWSQLNQQMTRYRHFGQVHLSESLKSDIHVKVVDHIPSSSAFQDVFIHSQSWGRNPILIRGAFQAEAQNLSQKSHHTNNNNSNNNKWPKWEDVKDLASNEDAESRWITHVPNDDTSWTLDLGPFDPQDVDESLSTNLNEIPMIENHKDTMIRSTLIVNDVDRFIPLLFKWIDETFTFIPNWRRDDGQISLANYGGGIGPHVDEYDVFLIQMAGVRKWELGKRIISVAEELEGDFLVPGLDVRIIRHWDAERGQEFMLYPGDVLYLPPRIAHCGIAQT